MPIGGLIGPAISGAGSLFGGISGKGAAQSASKAQLEAARLASQTQLAMYAQNREDLRPYRETGYAGLGALSDLEGLTAGGPGSDPYALGRLQQAFDTADPYFKHAQWAYSNLQPTVQNYLDRALLQDQYLGQAGDYIRTQGLPGASGYPVWAERPLREFAGSPDYKFARDEAVRAAGQQMAAQGLLGSGGQTRGLMRQGSGLASQNFQNYRNSILSQWLPNVNAWTNILQQGQQNAINEGKVAGATLQDVATGMTGLGQNQLNIGKLSNDWYNDYFNRLAKLAGIGQTAATDTARFGQQTGSNLANTQLYEGNAQASGILGGAQAFSSGIQGATSALSPYFMSQGSPFSSGGDQWWNMSGSGYGGGDYGGTSGGNPYSGGGYFGSGYLG